MASENDKLLAYSYTGRILIFAQEGGFAVPGIELVDHPDRVARHTEELVVSGVPGYAIQLATEVDLATEIMKAMGKEGSEFAWAKVQIVISFDD